MAMALELLGHPPGPFVVFDEKRHQYSTTSAFHPGLELHPRSVSHVMTVSGLKSFDRTNWKRNLVRAGRTEAQAEEFMDTWTAHRARVGTATHARIKSFVLAESFPTLLYDPEEIIESERNLDVWIQKIQPRLGAVLLVEQPLIHRRLFFSGTPDFVAIFDGKITILDWKSKPSEKKAMRSKDWIYQLAAYRELVRFCYEIEVNHAANVIIWPRTVSGPGGIKLVNYNRFDLDSAWDKFEQDALKVHHQAMAMESGRTGREHRMACEALFQSWGRSAGPCGERGLSCIEPILSTLAHP